MFKGFPTHFTLVGSPTSVSSTRLVVGFYRCIGFMGLFTWVWSPLHTQSGVWAKCFHTIALFTWEDTLISPQFRHLMHTFLVVFTPPGLSPGVRSVLKACFCSGCWLTVIALATWVFLGVVLNAECQRMPSYTCYNQKFLPLCECPLGH